jgi:hypothetical protein
MIAWVAALAGLVQRDLMRTSTERMAELALRVNPGNFFYAVEQDGKHIGFASSTLDTLPDSLVIRDLLVADRMVGGTLQRVTTRTDIVMSRQLALRTFAIDVGTPESPARVAGRADGDSAIVFVRQAPGVPVDTQRVVVRGPVVLPALLPLAAILRRDPAVGNTATYHTFDPATAAVHDVTVRIDAESLFTVIDSSARNLATGVWVPALRDTVRAWRLTATSGSDFSGWVDAQGRIVETSPVAGLGMRRMAYEMAFENWRASSPTSSENNADREIVPVTVIASSVTLPARGLTHLSLRLTAPSLREFALNGGRQSLSGDVLTLGLESDDWTAVVYVPTQVTPQHRSQFNNELRAETGLQTRSGVMLRAALNIIGRQRTARAAVERLVQWTSDSIARVATNSVPDAAHALSSRRGDVDEHAQLFAALARSVDVPTRIVNGLVYVNGKFYYHAWAEVFVNGWVAVDPTFGQVPADAAHVRLMTGGFDRKARLMQLIGTLHIEVLEAR